MNLNKLSELISQSSGCINYSLANGERGTKNIWIDGNQVVLYALKVGSPITTEKLMLTSAQIAKIKLAPKDSLKKKPDLELCE